MRRSSRSEDLPRRTRSSSQWFHAMLESATDVVWPGDVRRVERAYHPRGRGNWHRIRRWPLVRSSHYRTAGGRRRSRRPTGGAALDTTGSMIDPCGGERTGTQRVPFRSATVPGTPRLRYFEPGSALQVCRTHLPSHPRRLGPPTRSKPDSDRVGGAQHLRRSVTRSSATCRERRAFPPPHRATSTGFVVESPSIPGSS